MKRINLKTLLLVLVTTCLVSCNQTDNLSTIFLKHNKKMTDIVHHVGGKPTSIEKWTDSEIENLRIEDNYILIFDGIEENDQIIDGTFTFKVIKTTVVGKYTVDAKSKKIYTKSIHVDGSETDAPAKEAVKAMYNLTQYDGDSNTFKLYYKREFDDSMKPFMMFKRAK